MRIAISAPIQIDRLAGWLPDYDPCDLPVGYGGAPSTSVALGLLARGHDVIVVTLDPNLEAPVTLHGDHLEIRVAPARLGRRTRDYWRMECAYIRDALVDVKDRVDVVSAHWAYEFALGALRAGVPTAVHLHDWAPSLIRYAPKGARAHFAVKALMTLDVLRRGSALSAVSPYVAGHAHRWARQHVSVIPNAIPDDLFVAAPLRRNSASNSIVAMNQGFSPYKNVGALLEAFPAVRSAIPDARLRLIGVDMEMGGLTWKFASARGLTEGVEFVGEVNHSEVRVALDAADVFAHPSLLEACPMVVIDAMARSVPVVGGRASGGVPWVLDEGRSGALVDVQSPPAIANAVIRVLRDEDEWERLASAAFESARRRFAFDVVVDQYEEFLTSVAATAS